MNRPFELASFKTVTNKVIRAFPGLRQGKFVRKGCKILLSLTMIFRFLSRTFLFCSGLIHLALGIDRKFNEQSAFLQESSKENSRRANFRSKNQAKLSVDTNYRLKIRVD